MSLGAPWMLIAAAPLAGVYYWLQSYYRATSIEIRRFESKSKAPVYSHFSETIGPLHFCWVFHQVSHLYPYFVAGVSSVRAYSMMDRFSEINKTKITTAVSMTYSSRYVNQCDDHLSFAIRLAYFSFPLYRWFNIRLALLSVAIQFAAYTSISTRLFSTACLPLSNNHLC